MSITENVLRRVACCDELDRDVSYTSLKWGIDSTKLAVLAYGYIVVYDLSTNTIPTIVDLHVPNIVISSFDWTPDESRFAALHFKKDKTTNMLVLPLEVVMGFWGQDGTWQSRYEQPDASVTGEDCVPHGKDEFLSSSDQIGLDVEWAPDNQTLALSLGNVVQITVCSIQNNGKLMLH